MKNETPRRYSAKALVRRVARHLVLPLVLSLATISSAIAQIQTTRYVNTSCSNNGDGTTSSCAASAGAAGSYTTLANALSDTVADFPNLVSADRWLDIQVAGSATDTVDAVVSGFTTDATHYVKISAQGANRHAGVRNNSIYRRAADYSIAIANSDVWIDGMQIQVGTADDNGFYGIRVTADAARIRISNNIIWGDYSACSSFCNGFVGIGVHVDHDGDVFAWNNLIYDLNASGANRGIGVDTINFGTGKMYLYNNTILADIGVRDGYSDIVAKNNVVSAVHGCFTNASNVETTSLGTGTNYNAVSCATVVGANSRASQTFTFVNAGAKNYHLASGDGGAKDFGSDLSADGNLAFSTDIDADTRSGSWDIGADEIAGAPTPTPTPTPAPTATPTQTPTPSPTPTPFPSEIVSLTAQTEEICGNGIADTSSTQGMNDANCSANDSGALHYAPAVYSAGCDLLCPGIDKDQDEFYSESSGLRTETAQVNGAQSSVNTVTVDSGHALREGMFIDVASPARRVTSSTSTTVTFRGAPVTFTDNQVIAAIDAIDCDDTNRDIIPGEAYPCDPDGGGSATATDGYRYCLSTGSYGTCVAKSSTPFCPDDPGNNNTCWYVSPASGSDTTGNGSYANPWQTAGMMSGGSPGSEPAGARTFAPGDTLVMLGNTDQTTSFVIDSQNSLMLHIRQDGNALAPMIITRDPGATVRFRNSDGEGISLYDQDFVEFRDVEVSTNANGQNFDRNGDTNIDCSDYGSGTSIDARAGNNRTFIRTKIHHGWGCSNNNNSGIYCTGKDCRVHNSIIWNYKYQYGSNADNISELLWLDNANSGSGSGHGVWNSVLGYDSFDFTNNGNCAKWKHGPWCQDVGPDGHPVYRNIFQNCRSTLQVTHGSCLRVQDNVALKSRRFVETIGSEVPDDVNQDLRFEHNTILDQGAATIGFKPTYNARPAPSPTPPEGAERITSRYNIIRDVSTSYVAGNNEGVYSINGYGTDAQMATFENHYFFVSDFNCFYNPNRAINWNYFGTDLVGAGDEGGANLNFAGWKALSSNRYDQNSLEVNLNLDSFLQAQASGCETFGRRFVMSAEASPTPTPAPTASPSPTPTASPSPTPTASPSPTPTVSPTPTESPTNSPTPTPTQTPIPGSVKTRAADFKVNPKGGEK